MQSEHSNGNAIRNILFGLLGFMVAALIFIVGLSVGVAMAGNFGGASAFTIDTPPVSAGSTITNAGNIDTALMSDVLKRLKSQWYGEMPSDDKLTDGALRGMVAALGDPYTAYIEPQYAKILEQDVTSKFEGIGATLKQTTGGAIQIVRTFEGSPAEKGGVLAGDVIDAVDGTKVTGLSTYEVAALVRGPKGTRVTLSLRRADRPKTFDLTLTRAEINIPLVTSKMVGDGQIAYVSLFDFSQQASSQLNSKLGELMKQNPKGVILDLRDNPGGLLSQAIDVGSIFLKPGLFIIERDNNGNEKRDNTSGQGIARDVPLVVLVNGGSASASEIVAGAIQDYGRAKLIGETTFGKGSVQLPQSLPNGGQLRVTIQHWYTPNGRGIHGTGITPDFTVVRTAADDQANQDPQLDAAVNYLLTGEEPAPTALPTVAPTPAP
jgi:carboxyl-terminal processing protease